jgi:apolipoprotein N-acyltransferase
MNFVFWLSLLASGGVVAFGQPAWIPALGNLSAVFGFALFWKAMLLIETKKYRFWTAVFWFGAVHAIQLSWMTSTYYLGPLILVVYVLLLFGLGLQFGFLSSFLLPRQPLLFRSCLALAGGWTLLEWVRVFLLSGFTWNPVGLALSCSNHAIQSASLFGIYGLSFWVILVNLAALNAFVLRGALRSRALWALLALFPYGFGSVHRAWVERCYKAEAIPFKVALVNTALSVEQKYGDARFPEEAMASLDQWIRVWNYLDPKDRVELIVLPEGAFPGAAYRPDYAFEEVQKAWSDCFGKEALSSLPSLEAPLAFPWVDHRKIRWEVSNAFLAQGLSNLFQSDVIIGLNEEQIAHRYNAAFCFHPHSAAPEKHFKRILAPVGEYIPLSHVSWIAQFIQENFGICDSFDVGKEATVFSGLLPVGAAICLEEVYGAAIRELRQNGAQLFVSLSNDVWFPSSYLAKQHFDHGKIRSVENGVYLLRSSNMGVTGGVDPLGDELPCLPSSEGGALYLSLPIYSYPTLYSFWGDQAILFLSLIFLPLFRKCCP